EYDREFTLNQCIIDFYYSIHNIKVDKDIALFFSLGSHYKKLSSSNKTVKREVSEICEDPLIESYIMLLASSLQRIELSSRDGTIEYTIDHEDVDRQERALKMDGLIYPKNTKNTLEQLLKNQNSDEFEQLVTSPKNIYYSVPQEENKCRPNFIVSKKNHKNTVCKLILGMFVLSVGLYVADYFLMEQKLFNPIKGVLPQDNFANLVIAAMLTIVIVYALSQLLKPPQEPPLSTVDDVRKKKLEPLHANKLRTT
ncbi:WD1261 family protein, partial [Wolbachia endosymbiont of Nasonia vitripennis]